VAAELVSNVGRLTSAKDELMGEVVIWTWLLLDGVLLKLGILPRLDETLLNSLSSSKVIRLVIPITSSSSSPPMLSSEAMGSTRGTGLFLMLAILEAYMRVLAVSSASLSRGEMVQTATVNEEPPKASRNSLDKSESW